MKISLPLQPINLTPETLSFYIKDGGYAHGHETAEVENLSIEPLASGTAFLGSLARLDITWTDPSCDLPTRLVAKTPTTDPGGLSVGKMLNVWEREAMFYARLAHQIATPVPACRANFVDGDRALLILDDLSPSTPGNQVAGATLDQARTAVIALAQLHAPFWGKVRTPDLMWVPGIDNHQTAFGLQSAISESLPRFLKRFGDGLPSKGIEWLQKFVPLLGSWRDDVVSKPLTIAHADYRVENMLFAADSAVSVIDWQTAMYTGGPTDRSFFVATNLEVQLRRDYETELIRLYVETLNQEGISEVTFAEIKNDYEHAHLWWMSMLANNLSSIETPDPRSAALFDAILTRLYSAAIDAESGRFVL